MIPHSPPLALAPLAYRVEQAALVVGLSKSKVWDLIAEGRIRARKEGAATLVLHDDLVSYLQALPPAREQQK
jgi:excisionase family DNA binding protein